MSWAGPSGREPPPGPDLFTFLDARFAFKGKTLSNLKSPFVTLFAPLVQHIHAHFHAHFHARFHAQILSLSSSSSSPSPPSSQDPPLECDPMPVGRSEAASAVLQFPWAEFDQCKACSQRARVRVRVWVGGSLDIAKVLIVLCAHRAEGGRSYVSDAMPSSYYV